MAVKIKDVTRIAEKWSRVTPGRSEEYRRGVGETPAEEWESPTKAAEPVWGQAVQQAASRKAFSKGVAGAGAKWKRKAEELGSARYGTGVAAAGPDYAAGFAPYREAVAGAVLPPKGPTGDPANYERVRVLGELLHRKRVGG